MSVSEPSARAALRAAYTAVAAVLLLGGCAPTGSPPAVAPVAETGPVPHESDDPAIWRHPTDPSQSLILGTDKVEGVGGLYVFGLDGRLRQAIAPLDRPNNVDVEYGVAVAGRRWDIAVVTERKQRRLRLFGIDETGRLADLAPAGLPVFEGAVGSDGEPMGVAVFTRPSDGTTFVIVSPKSGPRDGYLAQYRLVTGAHDEPGLTLVRRFGRFSGVGPEPGEPGEIEAIVVDDALGYLYYSDERCCVRKYAADPDAPDAATELAAFGHSGYSGDREGLAILDQGEGRGFVVSVDQAPLRSSLLLYPRQGTGADPHRHPLVHRVSTASDETDGLEVRADIDLPGRATGLGVMMHDAGRSFRLYDVASIAPPMR